VSLKFSYNILYNKFCHHPNGDNSWDNKTIAQKRKKPCKEKPFFVLRKNYGCQSAIQFFVFMESSKGMGSSPQLYGF